MAGRGVQHHESCEVRREQAGDPDSSSSHGRPEEHVDHPNEDHRQRAIDLVMNAGADCGTDTQIDESKHERPCNNPARVGNSGPKRQRADGCPRCHNCQNGRRNQPASQNSPGSHSGQAETQVCLARSENVEKSGYSGQERRRPAGSWSGQLGGVLNTSDDPRKVGDCSSSQRNKNDRDEH